MSDAGFEVWRASSIAAYAQTHVDDGLWPADEALCMAVREIAEILPGGRDTPGHRGDGNP